MVEGNRKVQYFVTLAVSLASMTTGMILSWATPSLRKLSDNETSIHINRDELTWVASLGSPGFIAGSLASRWISDTLGRRATLIISALPVGFGTVLLILFSNVWCLYIVRVLWGISLGMVTMISTIYLAEIADKEIRGMLSVASRFMFNFGSFLVLAIGPFVSFDTLNYLMLVLPVAYFVACWFIPETPYHLLKKGKVDQARKALSMLRNYSDDKEREEDLLTMKKDVNKESVRSGSLKELLTGRQYRKAVIICSGLKITQIMCGSIVIQNYLGLILKDSHIDMDLATACIIFGAVRFISGIAPSVLADKVGRRLLLITSYIGTGLALLITAAYFFSTEVWRVETTNTKYGIFAFVGIILSVILSTSGFYSLTYVIPAEIFPMNVKAVAMTSINIFGGLANFALLKLYQQLANVIGLFGIFTVFSLVSLSGGIFCFYFVPETRGKSLREIQVMLQDTKFDETAEALNTPEEDLVEKKDSHELKDMAEKV